MASCESTGALKVSGSGQKKNPPANRRAFQKICGAALDERLRNLGVQFDRVRMITFNAVQLVASLQHAVELVDEHGNRLVTFIGLHGRIHVRSLNRDVTLGLELDSDRGIAIAFQFDAHPDDALLVAKQPLGFLADKRLQGRCQIEVNAGYD
jgi:hypothetical protein